MKIACEKCLKVEDADKLKDWLRVRTDYSEFWLCPHCADGFWMAIDHKLPSVVKEAAAPDLTPLEAAEKALKECDLNASKSI